MSEGSWPRWAHNDADQIFPSRNAMDCGSPHFKENLDAFKSQNFFQKKKRKLSSRWNAIVTKLS